MIRFDISATTKVISPDGEWVRATEALAIEADRDELREWKAGATGAATIAYPPGAGPHTEEAFVAHRAAYRGGSEAYRIGADVVSAGLLAAKEETLALRRELAALKRALAAQGGNDAAENTTNAD